MRKGVIGWCAMQFAEALLWMTDPKKCTLSNRLITLMLIPFVLALQPLGCVWGSLFFKSWNENKNFIIAYTFFVIFLLFMFRHVLVPMLFEYKNCTTITPNGHLDWTTNASINYNKINIYSVITTFAWCFVIAYPLLKYWNVSRLWHFYIIPLIGLFIGLFTDSVGSIWCYITSYGSISAVILLFLHNHGIKNLD